jgi:hypothetical protein
VPEEGGPVMDPLSVLLLVGGLLAFACVMLMRG